MIGARRDEYAKRSRSAASASPEEVAQAVLMVLGNAYMTGQTVPVNGGLHFN
jgi:3-oxoacyl-[acyl-carrier protein] reductase